MAKSRLSADWVNKRGAPLRRPAYWAGRSARLHQTHSPHIGDRGRNSFQDPVRRPETACAVGLEHQKSNSLGESGGESTPIEDFAAGDTRAAGLGRAHPAAPSSPYLGQQYKTNIHSFEAARPNAAGWVCCPWTVLSVALSFRSSWPRSNVAGPCERTWPASRHTTVARAVPVGR